MPQSRARYFCSLLWYLCCLCWDENISFLVHHLVHKAWDVHAVGLGVQHVDSYRDEGTRQGTAAWPGMRCFRHSSTYTSFGYPTDAPFSISNSAVSTFSQSATQCRQVLFSVVRALTDTPFLINNATVSAFPPTAVQCSRVSLSVVRALTYAPSSISDSACFESPR
jgi:hypothetical protein